MAAASSGAIRAGKAFVELGTDDTALQKGLTDAQTRLTGFFGAVESLAGALAFGVLSSKITDLVKMWADAGDELYKKAEARGGRLGDLVANPEDVGRAHDLAKAFESVEKATKSLKESIGGILAPAFEPVLRAIAAQIDATREWIKENEQTVQMIGWTVSGLAALGAGILGVVGILKLAGVVVGSLVEQFTSIVSIATSLVGLLANPFAWAIAAIVAFVAWIGYASGAFEYLGKVGREVWGGIVDAIMAGELELAFEIAVAGMKVVWEDFANWFVAKVGRMAGALGLIGGAFSRGLGYIMGNDGNMPIDGNKTDGKSDLQTARQRLEELMKKARMARAERDAELRDRTFAAPIAGGSRGLFNASAAFGLVGPSKDIVTVIESEGQRMQRLMQQQIALLTDIADNQAAFA